MASNRITIPNNLNFQGTHDILMVKTDSTYPGDWPEGQITFGLYEVPMKITGLQKVAQHYLKTLLTTKGSDPFYPTRGTFMPNLMLGANILSDDAALFEEISDAVGDASDQVRVMLNVNTADIQSTLDRVEIVALQRVTEGWFVGLTLYSLAGEEASIAVPFPDSGFKSKGDTFTEQISIPTSAPLSSLVILYSSNSIQASFSNTSSNLGITRFITASNSVQSSTSSSSSVANVSIFTTAANSGQNSSSGAGSVVSVAPSTYATTTLGFEQDLADPANNCDPWQGSPQTGTPRYPPSPYKGFSVAHTGGGTVYYSGQFRLQTDPIDAYNVRAGNQAYLFPGGVVSDLTLTALPGTTYNKVSIYTGGYSMDVYVVGTTGTAYVTTVGNSYPTFVSSASPTVVSDVFHNLGNIVSVTIYGYGPYASLVDEIKFEYIDFP